MKTAAWGIVFIAAIGAMTYFALRHSANGSANKPQGPASWSAADAQYITAEHAKVDQALQHASFTQACAILDDLLAKYPGDATGHMMLAKAMMGQGRWEQAYAEAKKSCELDDRLPEAQMLAGVLAERFDDLPTARAHYQHANDLNPASLQSALYLANVCLKLKDYANADLYALRVLRLDPSKAIGYVITAQCAAAQGQIDRAIEQWDKALIHTPADNPQFVPYTIQRVMLLRRRDMAGRNEALNVLLSLPQKVLDNDRSITKELAQTYLSLDRPADASDAWLKWLNNHPLDGAAAAEAGLTAQRAGLSDRARQCLALAKKLAPNHPLTAALDEAMTEKPTAR